MSESGYIAWGHGTTTVGANDCGCVYGEYNEAALVGPITKNCINQLRAWGIKVYSDVDTNNDRNMTVCVQNANADGVSFYFSVHCDYSGAPSGTYPIVYPGSAEGLRLANCLNAAVMCRLPIKTRGILQTDYYEVTYTDSPACIFETGGIKSDLATLRDKAELYGFALACGVMDYLGKDYDKTYHVDGKTITVDTKTATAPKLVASTATVEAIDCRYGDNNIVVGQMQRDLRAMGYTGADGNPLVVDDAFGTDTAYAVGTLQKLNGLTVDKIYGPNSDAALMREIRVVQRALVKLGYDIKVDGAVGNETHNALVDAQIKGGSTGDGIVGTETKAILGI